MGFHCIVPGCLHTTNYGEISLFRLPRDTRLSMWLKNCKRTDLSHLPADRLHQNYRICAAHFEDCMFSNPVLKNRLIKTAIPTLFTFKGINIPPIQPSCSSSSRVQHYTSQLKNSPPATSRGINIPPTNIQTSCSSALRVATVQQLNSSIPAIFRESWDTAPSCLAEQAEPVKKVPKVVQSVTSMPGAKVENTAGSQTFGKLTRDISRERELQLQVINRKRKVASCQSASTKKTLSEEDFLQFCQDHFSEGFCDIIKSNLNIPETADGLKGHRFSKEYKEFASTLYFLGPRAYSYLSKIICLPSKSTLQRVTQH